MENPFAHIDRRFDRLESMIEDLREEIRRSKPNDKIPATRRDAAKYLGISLPTLDNLEKYGKLRGVYIGRQKRFRWEDIEALLKEDEHEF